MPRRSTHLFVLLFALGLGSASSVVLPPPTAHAQEADPTAQQVLDAIAADDAERLKELALLDDPDPWLVADQLYLRGELDAALKFAQAAPRPDTETLSDYLESRRGEEPDAKAREALESANAAAQANDWPRALRILDGAEQGKEPFAAIRLRFARAVALGAVGRTADSVALYELVAEEATRVGWLSRADAALMQGGLTAYRAREHALGVPPWRRRIELSERRGDRQRLTASITNTAVLLRSLKRYEEALELQQRALAMAIDDGNGVIETANLVNVANTLMQLGRNREALDHARRGRERAVEVGHREFELNALTAMGTLLRDTGELREALGVLGEGLVLAEELRDEQGRLRVLQLLASAEGLAGSFDRALARYREALGIARARGDRFAEASIIGNLGATHGRRGESAQALVHYERALELEESLGRREGIARRLLNLGGARQSVGRPDEARQCFERAERLYAELGEVQLRLLCLGNLAAVHREAGEVDACIELHERHLSLAREHGDRASEAAALAGFAGTYAALGDSERALELLESSLELRKLHGDAASRSASARSLARHHMQAGDLERAREYADLATAWAEEAVDLKSHTMALGWHVIIDALDERHEASAAAAVELLELITSQLRGFDDVTGADVRDGYSNVLSHGTHAAALSGDVETTVHLLEGGRAVGLLEALGGRDRVAGAGVSAELRVAEAEARAKLDRAQAAISAALASGELRAVKEARNAVAAAQREHVDVVSRIQRTKLAAADVAYPSPASVEEIQGTLRAGEVMVLYSSRPERTLAVRITSDDVRILNLGPIDVPQLPEAAGGDWSAEIARLRRQLIEPLQLGDGVRRLLVSGSAHLTFAPFQLLTPHLDVTYVPSGTAYVRLRESSELRGEKVLALGDPAYEKLRGTRAAKLHHGDRAASLLHARLARLPGTRKEAIAVGDVTLLGEEASESRLAEELAKQERWRAVHLACHGLVVPDRPHISSLAITPDDASDGALTVLEILRSEIPADLVVLSACETGRGKVSTSEGVVGFTRSFMVAGAPRVIVSLWKVDDAATSALMQKFYELWKPGGVDTATALRRAQEHVAAQEKWKDPYYWAAWQLWGLPD